jgi:pyruvate dehydrogenase E1 component alpha subunit
MAKATSSAPPAGSHAAAPINQSLTPDDKIGLYRLMSRIRRFEQVSLQHYQGGKMAGFLHLYIGQESVAVGTISLLGENDHVITAYRDHAHALAVGMGMDECMAELFGKATGCSKGKGGSMHYFEPSKNYWGGHGIVAGQTPLGLGLAYGLKFKKLKGAALCYLGDGAVNQGAFHESLNLAALWSLPVIYIIENNGYSMGTSQSRSSAYPSCLAERAAGYDMDWELFSGEDIYEVRARTQVAIERAHTLSRPAVLEIATYRWEGHSVADANKEKYRTKEELESMKEKHDVIETLRSLILEQGITEGDLGAIDKDIKEIMAEAVTFAKESPEPDEAELWTDILVA